MAIQQENVHSVHDFPSGKILESKQRLYEKLYRDLGKDIIQFIENPHINEIMLNPDGGLWVDSEIHGLMQVCNISSTQAMAIINGVSGIHEFVINQHNPRLEAHLPIFKSLSGERFTAQVSPIVLNPSFSIRKRSEIVYTLDDYVNTHRMTGNQSKILSDLVVNRKNILICGGPGSGKTTVTNTLIQEAILKDKSQRFLILEDLPELQCRARNTVAMLTSGAITLRELLKAAMRMRPDRILIGEVRGSEALDMLKAWNTGCPGGICTVHANGVEEALQRVSDLAMEAGLGFPPTSLISHTIDAVVSVVRQDAKKGFIQQIAAVEKYEDGKFIFKKLD